MAPFVVVHRCSSGSAPDATLGCGCVQGLRKCRLAPSRRRSHHQALQAGRFHSASRAFFEQALGRWLPGCWQPGRRGIAHRHWAPASTCVSTAVLRPAKLKSGFAQQGARQVEGSGLPNSAAPDVGRRVKAGPAASADLSGGLAGGVVDGFAQQLVVTHAVHAHQLGVPTRHQQGHERGTQAGRRSRAKPCPSEVVIGSAGRPSAVASETATPAPTSSAPASPGPGCKPPCRCRPDRARRPAAPPAPAG